jgi:hypothetical protein
MISAEDIKIERIEENLKSRFLDRVGHKNSIEKWDKTLKQDENYIWQKCTGGGEIANFI